MPRSRVWRALLPDRLGHVPLPAFDVCPRQTRSRVSPLSASAAIVEEEAGAGH